MNTIWDNIYRNYQRGGRAWGTLGEEIMPQFVEFVEHANFPIESAFDIGVGTGSYLQYLSEKGFKIAGLDNSETAIAMAKERLGKDATIVLANAFDFEIPRGKYDFIFSVSTIHHGFKGRIRETIGKR